MIELLLPFSVLGSRFSYVAFWICFPENLTGQAWLVGRKSLAVSTQCPLSFYGSPSAAGLESDRLTASILPDGEPLAAP